MKKALIGTALATGILLATPSVMAGTGYVGLDYQLFTLSPNEAGAKDFEPEAVALKIGGSLSDYAMIEGRIGSSTADDSANDTALQVDNIIGFYVKGGMDLMNMVFPYAIIGVSKADLQIVDEFHTTESDLSYGVGADVHFGDFQVGAEWMMMLDETDYELEVMSVSGAWRF